MATAGRVHRNLPPSALYEEAVARGEAAIVEHGPLAASTGVYTGRSPRDKFIVREPSSESSIGWGPHNQPIDEEAFDRIFGRLRAYLQGRDLFVQDRCAGADPAYRLNVRVVTERA